MARCRSEECQAEIRWVHSRATGSLMPIDVEPVEGGTVELIETGEGTQAVVHPPGHVDLFGGPRFTSHFATCPAAAVWRREHGVPEPMRFDGGTISEDAGAPVRLSGQLLAVHAAMSDGDAHTLAWLAERTGGTEAAVSARLRDLRKDRWGAHQVERQHLGGGLWTYRLVLSHDRCRIAG